MKPSVNLPGHGDIKNKGDVASWEENLDVMSEEFQKLENLIKIIFAHSYGSLVSVSSILREVVSPDYFILSALHFDDNYPKFVKNLSGTMAKLLPKFRALLQSQKNLSTDKAVVESYFSDPAFRSLTFRFGYEITKEQNFVNKNIAKLTIPTIVLQGVNDKVVPISASNKNKELKNVRFIKVENSLHEILNQDTRPFVLSEIHSWMRELKSFRTLIANHLH